MTYYPLSVGNQWVYKQKDGTLFTNTITKADPNVPDQFVIINSLQNLERLIRKEGLVYYTNNFDGDKFQVLLKDDPKLNDTWEICFIANGFNNILVMKVKETGITKAVENNTYQSVALLEAESKMNSNGNIISLNYFTQYYYAPGVGLILTTSSMGDFMPLIKATVK